MKNLPSHDRMTANILQVFHDATNAEYKEGHAWYHDAHKIIRRIAADYGFSVAQVAGVTAAISPGLRWSRNLFWAEELCHAYREKRAETLKVPTYSRMNVVKAIRILTGEQPIDGPDGILGGPKVTAFYRLLRDGGNETDVCIDGHAISIALGKRYGIRTGNGSVAPKLPALKGKALAQIADAYRAAAIFKGLEPHQMQAITWTVWRRIYLSGSTV